MKWVQQPHSGRDACLSWPIRGEVCEEHSQWGERRGAEQPGTVSIRHITRSDDTHQQNGFENLGILRLLKTQQNKQKQWIWQKPADIWISFLSTFVPYYSNKWFMNSQSFRCSIFPFDLNLVWISLAIKI